MSNEPTGAPSAEDLDRAAAEAQAAEATGGQENVPATPTPISDPTDLEHAELQKEFDTPKPEPKRTFVVMRPFSTKVAGYEGVVISVGTELELTRSEDMQIFNEYAVPPIWPKDSMDQLQDDQRAALEAGVPLEDPKASKEPVNSDITDSIGKPKLDEAGEPRAANDPVLVGPRGVNTQPPSEPPIRNKTVTDAVDSIGNVQVEETGDGDVKPHHQNVGPRGANRPPDTYRS